MTTKITDVNPLPVADADGGALNLTRFTGLGVALVVVFTAINGSWDIIFGGDTPKWAKTVVIIAATGAFAVVAAADILARGYAAARRGDMIAMPDGLTATLDETGSRDPEVRVVGVRFRRAEEEDSEFLIVKSDKSTAWVGRDKLDFSPYDEEEEPDHAAKAAGGSHKPMHRRTLRRRRT